MADALDNLALNYTKTLVRIPPNPARGGKGKKAEDLRRQLAPVISKYLRGNELTSEEQAVFNRTSLKGKSPVQVFREAGYTVRNTQDLLKAQDVFRAAMKEKKPVTEEQTDNIPNVSRSSNQPAEPTGSTGPQGTAGAGSGSRGRSSPPAGTYTALDSSGNLVSTFPKLAFNDKGQLVSTKPLMVGSMEARPATSRSDSRSDSRKSALDRARDILKRDTYQLGDSSILSAALEMRKPTPFKLRTEEQVAARNLVVRDRMAREQGKTYNPKATALDKAKSRMRDLATSQEGAKQFFADTGVSPRQARALSGERMPERRRTYESPRNPNVVRTETPSEKYEGRTNVSYRSFSPDEVNELEKRRRRNR
tara:strand:+ start:13556 stop:14650 length:1095 start_codon:yes stop_codon:yes gene_type:complete